jgi:hypothetical protein
VLAQNSPPNLLVVLDESVMYEQLQSLAAAAARPNIRLHILPLRTPHPVSAESFVVFSFGQKDDAILHDVVATEGLKLSFYIEDRQETYLHLLAFDTLLERALTIGILCAITIGILRMAAARPAIDPIWIKSSRSHANGNCVEIANIERGQVGMRDSKNSTGPVLKFQPEEWRAFLGGVRNGEFDKFSA